MFGLFSSIGYFGVCILAVLSLFGLAAAAWFPFTLCACAIGLLVGEFGDDE